MGNVIFVSIVVFILIFSTYVFFSWKTYKRMDEIERYDFVTQKITRLAVEA